MNDLQFGFERPATVNVDLADRGYDILIGENLIETAGTRLAALFPGSRSAIVTDENLAALHLNRLRQSLSRTENFAGEIVLPAGEATKSFEHLSSVCTALLELGMERGDIVIAFGGGVIGDLAGFSASVLRRGVRCVQMPTSLLAQVDSSVGGKTGINMQQGKNLIGTFHQPVLVLSDTAVLDTLPVRQMRAGYAEIVKYALIGDSAFFAWLEDNHRNIFSGNRKARARAIEVSCNAKARVVESDEREEGPRALLNLGHTFGHALEAFAGYSDRLLHGEAIAIGIIMAFDFSVERGLCSPADASRIRRHFEAVGLPVSLDQIPGEPPQAEALLRLMAQDKKVRQGRIALILVHGIGQAFVERDVNLELLSHFLACQVHAVTPSPGRST